MAIALYDEDEYYFQKIKELVEEKMRLCAYNKYHKPKEVNNKKMITPTSDDLKEFITREMNGSDMKLVIQKSLDANDLKKDEINRLSMPTNQLETHEFLTVDEKRALEEGGEFEVWVLGPRLRMHNEPMVLKTWDSNYVLKNKWNDFVKENKEDLKEETKIRVWSFRRDQQLCFAIACVETFED